WSSRDGSTRQVPCAWDSRPARARRTTRLARRCHGCWRRAVSTSPRLSEGAGFIGLRLGETSVDVVPAEGARVSSLRFGGREWLGGGWLEWVPDARRQRDPSDLFAETGLLTQTSLAADEEG